MTYDPAVPVDVADEPTPPPAFVGREQGGIGVALPADAPPPSVPPASPPVPAPSGPAVWTVRKFDLLQLLGGGGMEIHLVLHLDGASSQPFVDAGVGHDEDLRAEALTRLLGGPEHRAYDTAAGRVGALEKRHGELKAAVNGFDDQYATASPDRLGGLASEQAAVAQELAAIERALGLAHQQRHALAWEIRQAALRIASQVAREASDEVDAQEKRAAGLFEVASGVLTTMIELGTLQGSIRNPMWAQAVAHRAAQWILGCYPVPDPPAPKPNLIQDPALVARALAPTREIFPG